MYKNRTSLGLIHFFIAPCFDTTSTLNMQLLGGAGVLLVALAIYFLNMADGNRSRTADPLEIQLNLLRQDFNSIRLKLEVEIEDRRNGRESLQKKIFELQHMVNELKPTNLQTKILHRIYKGLSTEKLLRQQTQIDMMQLKTHVRGYSDKIASLQAAAVHNHTTQADRLSDLQIQIAGLKCDPCMPGLPGQEGETDRRGDNCTRHEGVSVSELRFSRADGQTPGREVIEAGGAAVRDGPVRAASTTVRTDGLFPADRRVYWETRLVWSLKVSAGLDVSSPVGVIGLRREGSHSDFGKYPGGDDKSWGLWINHSRNTWRYYCFHDGKSIFISAPVTATSPSVSHRLGFLLDPGARMLSAVDVNTNTRICTFSLPFTFSLPVGDAGSQRLVPVVWFGFAHFERRFSLPGVDPSRLPGAVTDLLQN